LPVSCAYWLTSTLAHMTSAPVGSKENIGLRSQQRL